MGIGPWQQAELIRDIRKVERDRLRRIVQVEIARLVGDKRVLLPDNEMIAMLDRIKSKITPPKPKPKVSRKPHVLTGACHGF